MLQFESYEGGDDGIAALGDGLKSNNSLLELYLVRFIFGWISLFFKSGVMRGLQHHCSAVTDVGASALADGLRWNSSLRRLHLVHSIVY